MPLLHNPMLDATPAERRATPAEEREMLRWAEAWRDPRHTRPQRS